MAWILDQAKALAEGYDVPVAGIFRGEVVTIMRTEENGQIVIKLPNTPYADKEYVVGKECLISDGEDE